jgi:formiminoglutamase
VAGWFSLLEPARYEAASPGRADDPRLAKIIEIWDGSVTALVAGRPVLVGFPQDEGVRRNHGREGAAKAPREIRKYLGKLTRWDAEEDVDLSKPRPPLDAGDVRIAGSLEQTQESLGQVVGEILKTGAVPIVLGGGHETAYGHYLGYVNAQIPVAILNVDAHLDVRPYPEGLGHSGSPFRQAMEHRLKPLAAAGYACLGAQPFAVSREHVRYVTERGGRVHWQGAALDLVLSEEKQRSDAAGTRLFVTVDADAFAAADVPGVSAPNPNGYPGREIELFARAAGEAVEVSSLELVEINPQFDVDGRSARWAAIAIWHFLVGLASRVAEN